MARINIPFLIGIGLILISIKVIIQMDNITKAPWMRSLDALNPLSWAEITRHICNPRRILCERRRDALFDGLRHRDAQELIHKAITQNVYKCKNVQRYGDIEYGGYDVCLDKKFQVKDNNCTVYSLGVGNRGMSFEREINRDFGCEQHVFQTRNRSSAQLNEPSLWAHHDVSLWGDDFEENDGASLRRLGTILTVLGHENRTIDVMKIDANGGEWPFFRDLARNRWLLENVKQLLIVLNSPKRRPKGEGLRLSDYAQIFRGISTLKRLGFENWSSHGADLNQRCCKYWADLTPTKVSEAEGTICCYQVYLINSRFK